MMISAVSIKQRQLSHEQADTCVVWPGCCPQACFALCQTRACFAAINRHLTGTLTHAHKNSSVNLPAVLCPVVLAAPATLLCTQPQPPL